MTTQEYIWNYFINKGFSPYGIAGMMGNIEKESNFIANNVEDGRSPYSDEQYTKMVDNGTYNNFVHDGIGYGLVQWTYSVFKQDLLTRCKNAEKSISNIDCQLDQLYAHLQSEGLFNKIKNATSIEDASNLFLTKFERPADQSDKVKNIRIECAKNIYNQFIKNQKKGGNGMKYSKTNPPIICMQTNSTCYKGTSKMSVKGILWHSTGANNTTIKRYVQPSEDDPNYSRLMSLIGNNPNKNDWNHISMQAGLNAWIGTLADGTVATVQTMPWDYKPWGCGSGSRGSCNNGWIQFEICEDNLSNKNYFDKIYKEACELTAYLCQLYNLNPLNSVNFNGVNVPVILCHQDSYKLGLGSNHSDVYHWFTKYDKNMDTVRQDVAKILGQKSNSSNITPSTPINSDIEKGENSNRVKTLQENLIKLGYNVGPDGADGDFGNNTLLAVIKFQQDNGLDADGIVGPITQNAINNALKNLSKQPAVTPSSSNIYRVRKSWQDIKSQAGAYTNLENAKRKCDSLGNGYKVFDNKGNAIYPQEQTSSESTFTPVPTKKPSRTYTDVMIGSSSKDERGQYRGGQAGDQTDKEVYILNWYNQNWNVVLRPKNNDIAERIAQAMEAACDNNYIGYDQLERNSLYTEAKKVDLDLSKITTPCECDCSSLVSICCICAGLPESIFFAGGNMRTTYNLREACLNTGNFIVLTDNKYLNQKNYLRRGDILLNENQHVVIVLSNGIYAEDVVNTEKSSSDLPYKVKVTTNLLNVRKEPSMSSTKVTIIKLNEIYTIVAEEGGWGKLKSGVGWINLDYTQKI